MNICYPKKRSCYPPPTAFDHSNIIKLSYFFVIGTRTGNLKRHLQRRHIEIYEVLRTEESKASESLTKEDINIYKVVISSFFAWMSDHNSGTPRQTCLKILIGELEKNQGNAFTGKTLGKAGSPKSKNKYFITFTKFYPKCRNKVTANQV